MTRYTPIIKYLLAWQLMLPLVAFYCGISGWIAVITMGVFCVMASTKKWGRNTYSVISAKVVVGISAILAFVDFFCISETIQSIIFVLWLYSMVAYTATSPYPLSIRMPVIIYTLALMLMVPREASALILLSSAFAFSTVMSKLVVRWRRRSSICALDSGMEEPPYSFSLATAIVAAVAINLCLSVAEDAVSAKMPFFISALLLSGFCVWLLYAKDWKKNLLAVSALVVMIALHIVAVVGKFSDSSLIKTTVYVLSVSPVMFHTTAPVFRGMRIVITLFAIYTALNRDSLVAALSDSCLTPAQQHAVIIGIDGVIVLILIAMAIHWKKNKTPFHKEC